MTGPPRDIFPYVADFCRSLGPTATPIFIDVVSAESDLPVECVGNVRRRTAALGGEEVLGWKIWEWYGVMIEAEFHMVWRSPDGQVHDVTPNRLPFKRVLFLPDPSLRYQEKQVANIRHPLIADPRVREFIAAEIQIFAIQNKGERAAQFEIRISQDEARSIRALEYRKAQLATLIEGAAPGRNELCRCGSGQKYKRCCGKP
jgi:SEC-C motif